eukprot:CAMPEP_0197876278 /NCGR_PEP_ID=MMETSP1439-20131203/5299_1 /TAXON_ID=66791 /ORGANISM="Gonyaulax spinifera, Strain CCMP409" /LENGTH=163 /DNA_ID=CAMNT_0043495553 /DNA_START=35 /DNA_END=522 /DNA_ORIENTATION=-
MRDQKAGPACCIRAGHQSGPSVREGPLRHQHVEVVHRHLPICVRVRAGDHLLQILGPHLLPKLAGDAPQVLRRDRARSVVVEEPEDLGHVLAAVALAHLGRHQVQEPRKVQGLRPVALQIAQHLLHHLVAPEAKGLYATTDVSRVDPLGAVDVEEVEGLLDLL